MLAEDHPKGDPKCYRGELLLKFDIKGLSWGALNALSELIDLLSEDLPDLSDLVRMFKDRATEVLVQYSALVLPVMA
jgi:hypothetical protein